MDPSNKYFSTEMMHQDDTEKYVVNLKRSEWMALNFNIDFNDP